MIYINIDRMTAGKEMDAFVAENVMGFVRFKVPFNRHQDVLARPEDEWKRCDLGESIYKFVPDYSTDIKAVWEVVDKLLDLKYDLEGLQKMHRLEYGEWVCEFGRGLNYNLEVPQGEWRSHAETAPLAICRAALKVFLNETL